MGLWKKTTKTEWLQENVSVMNSDVSDQEEDHELEKEIKKESDIQKQNWVRMTF